MITEYSYENVTIKQLCNCVKWSLNLLQMRDWQVDVYDSARYPSDYGNTEMDIFTHKGVIWVNVPLCKKGNKNPYSTAIHETIHIFLRYKLMEQELEDEYAIRALEPIIYREFCRANKRKEAREC